MIRMSYESENLSVVYLCGSAFEYLILACMVSNWTFPKIGYKALLSHSGCFTFATVGLLVLAILASFHKQTGTFLLFLWVRDRSLCPE